MKITDTMVDKLNEVLEHKGVPFRYKYDENIISGNPHIQITLPSMFCVDSFIINPTKSFFDWLQGWFMQYGIELGCNNDGSILWSKSGWEEDKYESDFNN